jgi:hypothetical protein
MSLHASSLLALSLSLLGAATTASAQSNDTFVNMRAGYAAATGQPVTATRAPALRVAAEVFIGGASGAGGATLGYLAGLLHCGGEALDSLSAVGNASTSCGGVRPRALLWPSYAGASLAIPLGVTLGGDRMGGTGRWWGSTLGTLVGSAAGAAVSAQIDAPISTAVIVYGAFTLVGAVVGYEISGAVAPSPAPAQVARARVSPVATVSPGGALLGLSGSF